MSLLSKIICHSDTAQFPKPAKLSLSMCIPLYECNVFTKFTGEASASSTASSRLPVIRLQKLRHVTMIPSMLPYLFWKGVCDVYF